MHCSVLVRHSWATISSAVLPGMAGICYTDLEILVETLNLYQGQNNILEKYFLTFLNTVAICLNTTRKYLILIIYRNKEQKN